MATNKIKQTKTLREVWFNRLRELQEVAETAINDASSRNLFNIRFLDIENISAQFQNKHFALIEYIATIEGADLAQEEVIRAEFDRIFYLIKGIHRNLFETDIQPVTHVHKQSNVKLPKIDLPKFDGTLKNWPSFFDLFKALIHDNMSLSDSEKFQYLLSCLSKDPLTIVKAIPLTAENYLIAFNTLTGRYQNIRLLASTYWQEIIDFPKLNSESAPALRKLLNCFSENLEALKNLSLPVESWSFVLFHILIKKLDCETIKRFELQNASTDLPSYKILTEFLLKQCTALESMAASSAKGKPSQNNNYKKSLNLQNSFSSHSTNSNDSSSCFINATSKSTSSCLLCHQPHPLYKCSSFAKQSPLERFNFAKQKRLCLNCLLVGHRSSVCKSQSTCRVCHSRHHTLLHFTNGTSEAITTSPNLSSVTQVETEHTSGSVTNNQIDHPSSSQHVNTLTNILPINTTVLLSTALIEVMDSRGNFQKIRALLDSASQASFITSSCCSRLGLTRSRLSLSINGLGHMSSEATAGVSCTVRSPDQTSTNFTIDAIVLPKICSPMPAAYIRNCNWPHLSNIRLADPNYNVPSNIDILLGADVFPMIMLNGQVHGGKNQPSAFHTIFGWVLIGKILCESSSINSFCISFSSSLDNILKQFWELEEVPQISPLSSEDILCEKLFLENYSRDLNGRYTVALPFKEGEPSLLETRSIALRRFFSLENRLLRDSNLYESYSLFMKDYLDSGHMEQVSVSPNDPNKCYYLPHHCVIKPSSPSTKLRVVFDASLAPPGGQSLNDSLLVGPKLQNDLSTILLHFRLHRFVFTTDIRQMYRQILIKSDQRDYQRILWRFSPHESVKEFRLTTVTFGVASSPFLAIRTLLQLAKDEESHFRRASEVLNSDLYVDDIVTGCNTLDTALSLQNDLISLLRKGGFELRKWASNHPSILESVPVDFRQQQSMSFSKQENSSVKILGLKWFPSNDTFSFQVDIEERPCTKRTILSDLARIFDPLGFLAPVTFTAKYLMQFLWTLGLSWDDEPPDHILKYWRQYKNELPKLSSIEIPRWFDFDPNIPCQLHGFCDSSEKGFSSVIYFRFVQSDDNIKTVLVSAKSKVAPLKKVSLPRLELCAAVLLSNLIDFVLKVFSDKLHIEKSFAWSDSSVALSWIKSSPHRWKTFVSNRVSHIQNRLSPSCWHHIRSKENPADCASRGVLPNELLTHSLWWAGPPWLCNSEDTWPVTNLSHNSSQSLIISEEEKKIVLSTSISLTSLEALLDKFSSLPKIQRIVAYCCRFIHAIKGKSKWKTSSFTAQELNEALLCLIKQVQATNFSEEISNIKDGKPLTKSFRKLSPFLDEEGLLRVGGRLVNSQIAYNQKHPILLPRRHRITELIIQDMHTQNLHPGLQTLRYLISQNYWILNAKQAIRSVLSRCVKCYRIRPKHVVPYMGNLPPLRVSQVKAFSCVGLDFGGPFYITLGKARGTKSQKAYLCLFVCFATKALHLELVSDLSAEAFLAALRRFIARRGRCSVIHSDCGTNFVGANKYLISLFQEAADSEKIEWRFNPPSAPHFGGLWEAGIKSVKTHLARVIGEQILTYEELYTVLVQIEALLNSRPLSELSPDPNDLSALTPGHFLTLEPLTALPDPDLSHLKLNTLNRWQLLQRLHQDFWKRWHSEYLNTLIQRNKWSKNQPQLTVGKLVLIKDDLLPPLRWRLGRVIKTHLGSDGICRVVTLRTAHGTLQRPVIKLCPLPCQ